MTRAEAIMVATLVAAAEPAAAASVSVEGTQFRVSLADGHLLAQDQLPGVKIAFGDGSGKQRRIRIDAVERDPRDSSGEVMLYSLSEQDPSSGEWRNLCLPDPDGNRLGFPLAGHSQPTGATNLRPESCSSPAPAAEPSLRGAKRRSNPEIVGSGGGSGLLRFARNDGGASV
jgi:hypothetical protein